MNSVVNQRWQVGEVTITKLLELESVGGGEWILPEAKPENVKGIEWLYPDFMDEQGQLRFSVHALVLETPSLTIVVDTCVGNDKDRLPYRAWHQLQTEFLEDFAAAGFDRETVDVVLCTHLHVDHVGWNTMRVNDAWVPTFPNARYLLARDEFEHYRDTDEEFSATVFADSVQPVFDAGLVDQVETSHQVCEEVRLVPTVGHTPGHVSVQVDSGGARALITGDIVHHPCQLSRLHWESAADHNPPQAEATRRAVIAEHADTPTLVIGTHFAGYTGGHVVSDGDSYRLVKP